MKVFKWSSTNCILYCWVQLQWRQYLPCKIGRQKTKTYVDAHPTGRFGWIVTDLPAKPSVKLRWYRNICLEYYADPGAENGRPFSGRWALGSWTELFYPIIYHVTRRLCPYANDVVSQTLEALRQAPKYAWDLAPLQGLHHVPPVAKCRRHRQACCDILLLYLGHALGEERVERHSGPLLVVRGGG